MNGLSEIMKSLMANLGKSHIIATTSIIGILIGGLLCTLFNVVLDWDLTGLIMSILMFESSCFLLNLSYFLMFSKPTIDLMISEQDQGITKAKEEKKFRFRSELSS